uniref:Uncharacterized protein n=1 Tax=Salix viminalis TaxID=40686 RepID=A0A6N2MFB8_SALVM
MENDIEQGSALDIEKAKDILKTLNTEVRQMPTQQNGSESHGSECCIYRVPNQLRNVNSKAYDPNLISIGPLHHGNKGLEAMEKAKLNYFRKFTEGDGVDEKKMCDIVISIKNQEERLRNCYSEKSILMESSDDFVKMILLDAVFIILFFLESNDDSDPKNFEPRMTSDIREDLMLLENQLPLFIIQEIYGRAIPFLHLATCHILRESFLKRVETRQDIVEGSRHFTDLLRNLMLGDFRPTHLYGVDWKTHFTDLLRKLMTHFTDLLRKLMLGRAIEQSEQSEQSEHSGPPFNPGAYKARVLKYSAVMLLKAGVRFQVTRGSCLVDITFDKGVLKIPRLEVDHNFERLIRNIMALEQCCYSSEAYICSYIKFMDHLIDSAEDVGLLVQHVIILHWLGDDAAVSNMINHFCENIGDNYALFGNISRRLNAHYENPWNQRKATLKLVYFPDIWRGTATVAAAILLILTFIQTLSSLKLFG